MQESDSAVVARVREGQDDAYRMLVEQHSRGLFRLAFRMTGNEQDAEDVVQETLLRAFRHMDRYESRASLSTWLHRIAANCALDLIRRRKRRQEGEPPPEVAGGDPSPARLAYSNQVRECVAEAMNGLSEQERTAFVLRHFEGESIENIGQALGLNVSAAKHSVFRAVQKLRRTLEPLVGTEL
jgi:RNA polymerase sigma-70 factor (ECF subfamily)